jgi:hypothetical protein
MAFTIEDFRDLLQLLEQHPAWRTDMPALLVVAIFWLTSEAQEPACACKVWQATNGHVISPAPA